MNKESHEAAPVPARGHIGLLATLRAPPGRLVEMGPAPLREPDQAEQHKHASDEQRGPRADSSPVVLGPRKAHPDRLPRLALVLRGVVGAGVAGAVVGRW